MFMEMLPKAEAALARSPAYDRSADDRRSRRSAGEGGNGKNFYKWVQLCRFVAYLQPVLPLPSHAFFLPSWHSFPSAGGRDGVIYNFAR